MCSFDMNGTTQRKITHRLSSAKEELSNLSHSGAGIIELPVTKNKLSTKWVGLFFGGVERGCRFFPPTMDEMTVNNLRDVIRSG